MRWGIVVRFGILLMGIGVGLSLAKMFPELQTWAIYFTTGGILLVSLAGLLALRRTLSGK